MPTASLVAGQGKNYTMNWVGEIISGDSVGKLF